MPRHASERRAKMSEPRLTFPRTAQILDSRRALIHLLRDQYGNQLAGGPLLLLSGPSATKAHADVYQKIIEKEWQDAKVERCVLLKPPNEAEVEELATRVAESSHVPSIIVYVGGQTVGDATKWMVSKMRRQGASVVFGGIVTALSGDGLLSSTANLIGRDGYPVSMAAESPDFILGHKLTLLRQPYALKSSGVSEILAKISSLWDYRYSCMTLNKYHNDFAADLARSAYESLLSGEAEGRLDLHNPNTIDTLFRAIQLCSLSMQLLQSSETCSGSEHAGQRWLLEYIHRYNAASITLDNIPPPTHGASLAPLVIITLRLQGQVQEAEKVKRIFEALGLPCTAEGLGVPPIVLLGSLVLGLGFRCPRYLAFLLANGPFPQRNDRVQEKLTILEEIEYLALPQAIRTAMIEGGVAQESDFSGLVGAHLVAMQAVVQSAMVCKRRDVEIACDEHTAGAVVHSLETELVRPSLLEPR